MFYVYGWNSIKIRAKRPQDIRCFECNKIGQMNVNKYVNYAHVFWIPFFPYRIVNEFECVHCRTSINYNEMGIELKRIYGLHKSSAPPVWSFSGIILIIIEFGFFSKENFSSKRVLLGFFKKFLDDWMNKLYFSFDNAAEAFLSF